MDAIVAWMVGLMLWQAPADKLAAMRARDGLSAETAEARASRYESIAKDIVEVTMDGKAQPLFGGKHGRVRTAAFVLAVALRESALDEDVDRGPCYREGKWAWRCDHGRAACILQIQPAGGETLGALFADRKLCLRTGIRRMAASFSVCTPRGPDSDQTLTMDHRLAQYARGWCDNAEGRKLSEDRFMLWRQLQQRRWLPLDPHP